MGGGDLVNDVPADVSREVKAPYAPTKTILIDFDGTMCPFSWPGKPGEPYPNMVEEVNRLYDRGYDIVVFTARAWSGWDRPEMGGPDGPNSTRVRVQEVRDWLARYGVKYNRITAEKQPCVMVIDDSAIWAGDHFPWNMLPNIVEYRLHGHNLMKDEGQK